MYVCYKDVKDMDLNEIIDELRVCNYSHFDEFYNSTKKTVFFAIAAIVSDKSIIDDLMQDTYIRFLENIGKYKSNTSINAYLSTMAHNITINYYNREKRLVHDETVFEYIPAKSNNEYEEIAVVEMLKDLDQTAREIVVLHVLNDVKFKDIAAALDKPLGTVLWIYNKAMKDLKKKVGGSNE